VNEFQYFKPESLPEAISLAAKYGPEATLLAGGTDLIVQMKRKIKTPTCVINLKGISELNGIMFSQEKGLFVGPLVTHYTLGEHPVIFEKYSLLAEAARLVGTHQIRERGTLGGNICNGSPAADTIPPLLCLEAKLKLQKSGKETITPIEDFFEGPQKTKLEPDEILTEIQLPPLERHTGGAYVKLGVRKSLEIAVVGVAALVTLDKDKKICLKAKIALASVAPIPLLCQKAEAILLRKEMGEPIINQAAKSAQEEAAPITDVRGTAKYRREMIYIVAKRALNEALKRASR
jgi:carbon-monoxide dehydrogenase medium subunit